MKPVGNVKKYKTLREASFALKNSKKKGAYISEMPRWIDGIPLQDMPTEYYLLSCGAVTDPFEYIFCDHGRWISSHRVVML